MHKKIWKQIAAFLLTLTMLTGSCGFAVLAEEGAAAGGSASALTEGTGAEAGESTSVVEEGTDAISGESTSVVEEGTDAISGESTSALTEGTEAEAGETTFSLAAEETDAIPGLTEPVPGEPGHVHAGETLYLVDLYSGERDISYIKAKFFDAEPQLVTTPGDESYGLHVAQAGGKTKEIYMSRGSLYYSVKIPQHEDTTASNITQDNRPCYKWVCFEIHLADGSVLYHQRAYNLMGSAETYDQVNHTVAFEFETEVSDTVFIGRNVESTESATGFITRSYISAHPDSMNTSLLGKMLYFDFGDIEAPAGYTLNWGDGNVREFMTDSNQASAPHTWFYKFTSGDNVNEGTVFTLKDAAGNPVLRFTYSNPYYKNMLLVDRLLKNIGAWSVYRPLSAETGNILVNNFTAELDQADIRWTVSGLDDAVSAESLQEADWESWQNLDGPDGMNFYKQGVPRDRVCLQIRGTYHGTVYQSEPIRMSEIMTNDNPCFYPRRVIRNGEYLLEGYWGNALDITNTGDSVQDIPNGRFAEKTNEYYATADFYDYYSVPEMRGIALKDHPLGTAEYTYSSQSDIFNLALSNYYEKNQWSTATSKYPLYFGDGGSFTAQMQSQLYGLKLDNYRTVNGWKDDNYLACGMVDSTLTHGELTQNGKALPYFNEDFLRGNNVHQAAIGQVYRNAKFGFTKNENGYWQFDSNQHSAEVRQDPSVGYYTALRDQPIVNANGSSRGNGFYPLEQYMDNTTAKEYRNNMFGMHMDIPFGLTEDGTVTMKNGDTKEKRDIVFNFNGDDDVWIFVDGHLVLDIGGIHGANGGSINFRTGEVKYNAAYTDVVSQRVVSTVTDDFLKNLDKDASHTLSIFYLERGLYDSNLKISFNFALESRLTVSNTIHTDKADQRVFGEALSHIGTFDYYLYNQAVTGAPLAVENSEGYLEPGSITVLADGTEHAEASAEAGTGIRVSQKTDGEDASIVYENFTADTPSMDEWVPGSDAVKKRLVKITPKVSSMAPDAAYLYMKVKCNVASASGRRLYGEIEYADGTVWGGRADILLYNAYSNGIIANVWSEVRINLEGAPKGNIKSVNFAYLTPGAKLEITDIIAYGPIKETENTGFATDQTQISDYGSLEANALVPARKAFFTKYTKNEAGDNNAGTMGFASDMGVFGLADGQSAVFSDKFRFGSYLYLNEAVNDNGKIFDTVYTISEYTGAGSDDGYSQIPAFALVPGRNDVTTIENDALLVSLSNVPKRVVSDGRTSIVNGVKKTANTENIPALNQNEAGYNTFVYRNYTNPDSVEGTGVKLKVDYVNTLRTGSVTVNKVLQWTENDASGLSWEEYKNVFLNPDDPGRNESVNFRITFTNIAGRYLEMNLDRPVTTELEVQFTECDNTNHTITGTATFDGIPAGTEYKIEEIQTGGMRLWKAEGPVLSSTEDDSAHTDCGVVDAGAASYAYGRAYSSDAAYTFTNEFVQMVDIRVIKSWDSTVPPEKQGEVIVKLQRRITGGAWEDVTDNEGTELKGITVNGEYTFTSLPTMDEKKNRYMYRTVEVSVVGQSDEKYAVFYITNPDGSRTIINAALNRTYYVQNGVERELPILPDDTSYDKKAVYENYNITIRSQSGGVVTDTLFDIAEDGTITYTAPQEGMQTYQVIFTPKDASSGDTEQTIHIAVYAYDVNPDIYVLDYGLPARLADRNYPGQSVNTQTGERVLKNGMFANDLYRASLDDTAVNEIAGVSYVNGTADPGSYPYRTETSGVNGTLVMTQSGGKTTGNTDIVFTPTRIMDTIDQYSYKTLIRAADAADVAEENLTAENGVAMTSALKIMPASVVYYEDNFNGSGSTANTDTTKGIVYSGSFPVQITGNKDAEQSIDQDEAFGYDAAYNDAEGTAPGQTDSLGGSTQMNGAEQLQEIGRAKFTFTGTGFDVVGRTYEGSAEVMYVVKTTENVTFHNKEYAAGKIIQMGSVNTSYKTDKSDRLYQLPVISVRDLPHSAYNVELRIVNAAGKSFYLDGIRIYQPLTDHSYYNEKEVDTTYTGIREMILGDTKLTDQGTVSSPDDIQNAKAAIVSYGGNGAADIYGLGVTVTEVPGQAPGETSDINDYLAAGPKQELYLPAGSAVAFMVTPETTFKDMSVQIEAKAVNTNVTAAGYPTLLNVAGNNAQTAAVAVKSSTAMYYKLNLADCKKSADGKSCLVVLANSAESPADISLTNLKTKGCTLHYPESSMIQTTPSNEVPADDKTAIQNAYTAYRMQQLSDKTDASGVSIVSARSAMNYVRQDGTGYINVTLKNKNGNYRPQLYYYSPQGGIIPLATASGPDMTDGDVDPDTLYPVRDYVDQNGSRNYVFKVRVRFPAAKYDTGMQYFTVAAVNYPADGQLNGFTEITKNSYPIGIDVRAKDYRLSGAVQDADKPTNQDAVVLLSVDEEVMDIEGWERIDARTMRRAYPENGTYTVQAADEAGYEQQTQFTISNIDKEAPAAEVTLQSAGAELVSATLSASEEIKELAGWKQVNPTTYTCMYAENGENSVAIEDLAGNEAVVSYEVTGIGTPDKGTPDKQTPDKQTPDKQTPDKQTPDKQTPGKQTSDKQTPHKRNPLTEKPGSAAPGHVYTAPVPYSVSSPGTKIVMIDGVSYKAENAPKEITGSGTHTIKELDENGAAIRDMTVKIKNKKDEPGRTETPEGDAAKTHRISRPGFWQTAADHISAFFQMIADFFVKTFHEG